MLPDNISLGLDDRRITIDVGELLFPTLVLIVCGLYYVDTRGLPDQSMLYAGPVLYITALLAVVTIVQHAISLEDRNEQIADGIGERPVGAALDDERLEDPDEPHGDPDEPQESDAASGSPHFNRRSSAALAAITTAYITVITQLSEFVTDAVFVGLSAAFLGSLLFLFGERQWTRLIAYSVGFAVLIWGVFVSWLRVPIV